MIAILMPHLGLDKKTNQLLARHVFILGSIRIGILEVVA